MAINIGVIGVGGVGGYFGGKLTQLPALHRDIHIHFLARGEHLRAIQASGLILDTDDGTLVCSPTTATDDIMQLPELDACLVCVKSYDLDTVLPGLAKKILPGTIILPLLNGVDIYERIRSRIKAGIVYPSCVYVGTHIEKPGKVIQRGGSCTIILGKDPQQEHRPDFLLDLFRKSGIKSLWQDDPYPAIWSKFIFIAAFGLVTAAAGKSLGEVLASAELSASVKGIMEEIAAIACKKGAALQPAIVEDSFNKGKSFPFAARTSFQRDFETTGRPDERDLFGGTIIRLGAITGIATGTTQEIYAALQNRKPQITRT